MVSIGEGRRSAAGALRTRGLQCGAAELWGRDIGLIEAVGRDYEVC